MVARSGDLASEGRSSGPPEGPLRIQREGIIWRAAVTEKYNEATYAAQHRSVYERCRAL
jgi:hypothetical protein